MKILITGGSSLLGRYLLKTKPNNPDYKIALTWHKNDNMVKDNPNIWYNLDIRNRADVFDVFEVFRPNVVIHCAALGGVDFAEGGKSNPRGYQLTADVNMRGTGHITDACTGYKTKMVYISTNAVFSGKLPPYNEKSALEPVNAYGVIKKRAEELVRREADKWLIIRPFLLYGWPYLGGRTNWAVTIIEALRSGKKLRLVDDVIWMPTYANDCAETIWELLLKRELNKEIFNVSSPECVTLYEFGLKVCEIFGLDKELLEPVSTDHFRAIARRPKNTEYDLVKLSEQGIRLSDIKTGLKKMKEENE